jgi:hypothetical protein
MRVRVRVGVGVLHIRGDKKARSQLSAETMAVGRKMNEQSGHGRVLRLHFR